MKQLSLLLILFCALATSCNSCKTEPEIEKETAPIEIEQPIDPVEVEPELADTNSVTDKAEPTPSLKPKPKPETKPATKEEGAKKEAPVKKEVEKKKVVNYAFLTPAGRFTTDTENFDVANFAAEEVALNTKGDCGENCGKKLFAENFNNEKSISITVKITLPSNEVLYKAYTLNHDEKLEIGCTKDCTTDAQKVKYIIVSANYIE